MSEMHVVTRVRHEGHRRRLTVKSAKREIGGRGALRSCRTTSTDTCSWATKRRSRPSAAAGGAAGGRQGDRHRRHRRSGRGGRQHGAHPIEAFRPYPAARRCSRLGRRRKRCRQGAARIPAGGARPSQGLGQGRRLLAPGRRRGPRVVPGLSDLAVATIGAGGRSRTGTGLAAQRILSPVRLPVSPRPHIHCPHKLTLCANHRFSMVIPYRRRPAATRQWRRSGAGFGPARLS